MEPKKIKDQNIFSKWSNFFIKRYKVTILVVIGLIIAGAWGMTTNQRQDFPEVAVNYGIVTVVYPGASAENIEKEIITPIEMKMQSHEKIGKTRSTSAQNFGSINMEIKSFDNGKIAEVVTDIRESVDELSLPDNATIEVFSPDAMGEVISYILTSEKLRQDEILEYAPDLKEYLTNSSEDIKKIDLYPKAEFDIEVILDGRKLSQRRISPATIKETIQKYIKTVPAGSITSKNQIEKQINIKAPATAVKDLKNITVAKGIKLGEIASIKRVVEDENAITTAGYIKDGKPQSVSQSVYLTVFKENKGDVINIDKDLKNALDNVYDKNIIPKDINVIEVYNISTEVSNQINDLLNNGLIGLLAILIVFLFFIDIRTGIVISLIIPLAFLVTLFVLPVIGFSINILTIFAMILTLGILVDNAIVIAEGIIHRLHKYGETKYQAAIGAIRDLGPAVTAATATTIVVFIPFTYIGGIVGEFLKYIPYTIIIMLIGSYFLALTITPLFSKWILKQETEKERRERKLTKLQKTLVIPAIVFYGQKFIDIVIDKYTTFMEKVYKKTLLRIGLIALVVVLFAGSLSLLATGQIPTSQFPKDDTWHLGISVEFPKGTPKVTKEKVYTDIFKQVINAPHFESAFLYEDQILMIITPPDKRQGSKITAFDIQDELQEKFKAIKKTAPKRTSINIIAETHGPPASDYDVTVEFKNQEAQKLEKVIADLDQFIQDKIKNDDLQVKKIQNELKDDLVPMAEIEFEKNKINQYGISPFVTSAIINSVFAESQIGELTVGDDGVADNIVMKFSEESRNSINDLKNIVVTTTGPRPVMLKDIANVKNTEKAFSINHIDERRAVSYQIAIKADEEKRTKLASELEKKIKDHFNEEKLNEFGLNQDDVNYGGFASEINSNFNDLFIVLIIAMLAVYIILIYQFNSYLQPLMIMLTIPIAFIGVIPGIKLIGTTIDMISGLGIIALIGIVVNDAIVFIDYFNRQRKKHPKWDLPKTLIYTGKVRFKPIFSTSVTTMAGILPIAIVNPFWRGLGTSIVSGLIFSTIGTLVILPILIQVFTRKKKPTK